MSQVLVIQPMKRGEEFFFGSNQTPIVMYRADQSVCQITSRAKIELGIYRQIFETKQFIVLNEDCNGDSLLLRHTDGSGFCQFKNARICQFSTDESCVLLASNSRIQLIRLPEMHTIIICETFASTGRRLRARRYNRLIITNPLCREEIFGIENYFYLTANIEFYSQSDQKITECLKIQIMVKDHVAGIFYYDIHTGNRLNIESQELLDHTTLEPQNTDTPPFSMIAEALKESSM